MHQGKFKTKNPSKYLGDISNIWYRSSWELSLMLWCDANENIIEWSSEELVIPYLCPTDGARHRYFVDFTITFANGTRYWIELKPHKYTIPPKAVGVKKRRYIKEVFEYAKNQAKWKAANEYAIAHGAQFQVWTEKTLQSLGIKVLGT